MVSEAKVVFCGEVGGEEMDEDEWSEAASSSRMLDLSPKPGGMAMTGGVDMARMIYRNAQKPGSDCNKAAVKASDCRQKWSNAVFTKMGQSRAGWLADGRWRHGQGLEPTSRHPDSAGRSVYKRRRRRQITLDGRYCAPAKSDVSLDGRRGCSEVDLSDMCDFYTAVDGGNRVFRCGEYSGVIARWKQEGKKKERGVERLWRRNGWMGQ